MGYCLPLESLNSISDAEFAFSTDRLLPAWDDIPEAFKRGNIYTKLADAIFSGSELPELEMELHDGVQSEKLNRCVRAHLASFGVKHEHKIAGVGYMISCVSTISVSE